MPSYSPGQRQVVQQWLHDASLKPLCPTCRGRTWELQDDCRVEYAVSLQRDGTYRPLTLAEIVCTQCEYRLGVELPGIRIEGA